jgi:hypothetical protein
MRIITLERLAGIGEGDCYIYEGSGYLLRFRIESADQFFGMQLPFVVETLGIDPRQIMRLELLGNGYSGLRHAIVCISFEDGASKAKRPESLIKKLYDAPSTPPREPFTLNSDELRQRLIQFFLLAPNDVKARFLKDSAGAIKHRESKPKKVKYEAHVGGFLYRVSFDAGSPPSIAEWRNTLLYCSERLRRAFRPEQLDRVMFTAIPYSEQDYKVEAELLLPTRTKVYGARSELRFGPSTSRMVEAATLQIGRPEQKVRAIEKQTLGTFTAYTIGRPEQKLRQVEKQALDKFDELATGERLHLWDRHLSRFFR